MEVIRKQISLDSCRSHRNGLLPFVDEGEIKIDIPNILNKDGSLKYPNYNYGQFICDLSVNGGKIIKYLDIINSYNFIIDKLYKGVCGYGYITDNKFIVINICGDNILNCSDKFNCSFKDSNFKDIIFNYKPLDINTFSIIDENTYETNDINGKVEGYYVLIKEYDKYKEIENTFQNLLFNKTINDDYAFTKFVEECLINGKNLNIKNNKFSISGSTFELKVPTFDIPLLLLEEYTADSMYYTYEESYNQDSDMIVDETEEYKEDDDNRGLKPTSSDKVPFFSEIEVESKLNNLIHYSSIDINEELFGIPKDDSKIYACNFSNGIWDGKSSNVDNTSGFICKNGEPLSPNRNEYHKIPFLSCLKYMTGYTTNGTYHFLVNYKNDIENPIGIPFIKDDKPLNISEYQNGDISCDYIKSISIEGDKATIEYVLGADKNKSGDTGIHYMEKLNYFKESATTFVDGFKCDIFYEKLDYDTNLRSIYNYEYDLYSDVRIAKITKMTLGDVWNSGSSVNLPLVTKEGMSSLYSSPKFDIDMIFNRGNGAGWEKHFKLSECNTMKDLENYGNNFFNL